MKSLQKADVSLTTNYRELVHAIPKQILALLACGFNGWSYVHPPRKFSAKQTPWGY